MYEVKIGKKLSDVTYFFLSKKRIKIRMKKLAYKIAECFEMN